MNNKENLRNERPPLLPALIGTGFGSGFFPWGPGTAGSLLAIALWWMMGQWLFTDTESLSMATTACVIGFTILGIWATAQLRPYWGEDPSKVVVDEMVGMWIPLSLFSPAEHPLWILAALILFRFFDIVKPLGIKWLDRKQGPFWVMADDILGGVYAAASLIALRIILALSLGQ